MGTTKMEKVEERISITLENEGQKIFGVLHIPTNQKNVPAVLFCHGLAGHKSGKHRVYVDLAYRLAKRGIASLRFDYRGCGDSEGLFQEITPSSHYSDSDLCMDFLRQHELIDASRIGVFGRSFGGPIAVKTASDNNDVKSIALWCPMYSGQQWQDQWQLVQTNSVPDEVKLEMMQIESQQGSFEFFNEFFSIDVGVDLEKLHRIPLLHIHGENDTRVDMSHATDYENNRKNALGRSKFLRLPQSDHDFSHMLERNQALDETEQWFTDTLG